MSGTSDVRNYRVGPRGGIQRKSATGHKWYAVHRRDVPAHVLAALGVSERVPAARKKPAKRRTPPPPKRKSPAKRVSPAKAHSPEPLPLPPMAPFRRYDYGVPNYAQIAAARYAASLNRD